MKKKSDNPVIQIVIATGITSVATQLLTIREFLAQFNGNEFVIALILFNWLVLGGIGTLFARIVHARHKKTGAGPYSTCAANHYGKVRRQLFKARYRYDD